MKLRGLSHRNAAKQGCRQGCVASPATWKKSKRLPHCTRAERFHQHGRTTRITAARRCARCRSVPSMPWSIPWPARGNSQTLTRHPYRAMCPSAAARAVCRRHHQASAARQLSSEQSAPADAAAGLAGKAGAAISGLAGYESFGAGTCGILRMLRAMRESFRALPPSFLRCSGDRPRVPRSHSNQVVAQRLTTFARR